MKLLFLAFGYVAARGRGLMCHAPQLVIIFNPWKISKVCQKLELLLLFISNLLKDE